MGNRSRFQWRRRLTLEESSDRDGLQHGEVPSRPLLRLCGRWLADAGFAAGVEVQVEVGHEMLVIRPVASIKVPF